MKYIFGLIALCFCLGLGIDVGAVGQPIKTEFAQAQAPIVAQAQAPIVLCESIEVDFAIRPTFIETPAPTHPDQPGESQGNPGRSCGTFCEAVTTTYQSIQFEAPAPERHRPRTDTSSDSASAKEPDYNGLSDWKVGWQA